MTQTSKTTDLTLNGGIIDMRADNNTYSTLTTKKLSGSDGVIKQDIDVRDMKSDKILVTEDFSGTQALDIYQNLPLKIVKGLCSILITIWQTNKATQLVILLTGI